MDIPIELLHLPELRAAVLQRTIASSGVSPILIFIAPVEVTHLEYKLVFSCFIWQVIVCVSPELQVTDLLIGKFRPKPHSTQY